MSRACAGGITAVTGARVPGTVGLSRTSGDLCFAVYSQMHHVTFANCFIRPRSLERPRGVPAEQDRGVLRVEMWVVRQEPAARLRTRRVYPSPRRWDLLARRKAATTRARRARTYSRDGQGLLFALVTYIIILNSASTWSHGPTSRGAPSLAYEQSCLPHARAWSVSNAL